MAATMRCTSAARWGVTLLLVAETLAAAPTATERAQAQVLFDEARQLVAQGRLDEACPKLEESQRLEPHMVTAYRLGECLEKTGRLASAYGRYLEAAEFAVATGAADRENSARQAARNVLGRVSVLVIKVTSPVAGMRVTRDGAVVGPGQWGTGLPVDGGPCTVRAEAPGYEPVELHVEVPAESGRVNVAVTPLKARAGEAPSVSRQSPPESTEQRGAEGIGLVLAADALLSQRRFKHVDQILGDEFELGQGSLTLLPAARLRAAIFPFAAGGSGWKGLGLQGEWLESLPGQSIESPMGATGRWSVHWRRAALAIAQRVSLGEHGSELSFSSGLAIEQFSYSGDPTAQRAPSITAQQLFLEARSRAALVNRLSFVTALSGRLIPSLSDDRDGVGGRFPHAWGLGFEAVAGPQLRLSEGLSLGLTLEYRQNGYAMRSRPGDASVAGGALEQILLTAIGVRYETR